MRLTAAAKRATRQRILDAATTLFCRYGWQNSTTRAIALEARIATGTLFNYFPTKESVAATLIAGALERAGEAFLAARREEDSVEADLFLLIWSGLRSLREYRNFLGPAAETIFSPIVRQTAERPGDAIRVKHLELVHSILVSRGFPTSLPAVTVQLYWTLYLGVFAFWAADDSRGQEDSVELLDHSLKLFVDALGGGRKAVR